MNKAALLLQDGTYFVGNAIGSTGVTTGEICFNTGMTGYQEIFTDPSYYGQIITMATSHIGNYGVMDADIESASIKIAGLVTKKFSKIYSRPSGTSTLQTYFQNFGIPGISDIDTRMLVRHIRDKGAMNAIISTDSIVKEELAEMLADVPSMAGLELASKVSTKEPFFVGDESSPLRIAVIDYGVKMNILRCLAERGAYLKVFPHDTSFEDIKGWNPDGIMLSNGPGDPEPMEYQIAQIKKITASSIPTFGICLGHQLLALSLGLKTFKMHTGHRGVNHPVKNLLTGKCEITSQNHGFVVDTNTALSHPDVIITHKHLNDDTLAGIQMKSKKIFSVQFHPESSAGPNDSRYLFDQFIHNINTQN